MTEKNIEDWFFDTPVTVRSQWWAPNIYDEAPNTFHYFWLR